MSKNKIFLSGGPLPRRYNFEKFEYHIGLINNGNGSEHSLNGTRREFELHFIFRKEKLTYKEALLQPDGVAIVAYLGDLGNH